MKGGVDLLVAADSFIYFGDLDPLFDAVSTALSSGSYAAFTLEDVDLGGKQTLSAANPDWRWSLTPSGRFAHRKEYVVDALRKVGMKVKGYRPMEGFRYENGRPVFGHMFLAVK